jgi:hypothetical protein
MERFMDSVYEDVKDVEAEFAQEDELAAWNRLMQNKELNGLKREPDGTWTFDMRYRADSLTYAAIGPRSIDSNIIGPAVIPVPDAVCEFFGLAVVVSEPMQTEED